MITPSEFLRLFGNPVLLLINEKGQQPLKSGMSQNLGTDVMTEMNKDIPCAFYFTPNGNYWDLQTHGQPVKRSSTMPWNAPYYHALVVDVDLDKSTIKDKDKLLDHIHDVVKTYHVPYTICNATPGGYQIYRCIHPEDKQAVHDAFWKQFHDINTYLRDLFDGGDPGAQATTKINGLLRVPDSFHRKTGKPIQVKTIEYHEKNLIRLKDFQWILNHQRERKKTEEVKEDGVIVYGESKNNVINSLPIPDVIEKLQKYPRLGKFQHKDKEGNIQIIEGSYTFRLQWNMIHILMSDQTLYKTWWYRYENVNNYVNNFSEEFHPISERPQWWTYSFVYYYFNKNREKVRKFFALEFGVDSSVENLKLTEEIIKTIECDEYSVNITNKRVIIHREVKTTKGKSIPIDKDIFAVPIEIIGKSKIKVMPNGVESEDPQMVFLFKAHGQNKIIYRFSGKRKFNDRYAGSGLFFFWEDNDLWYFFDALDKSDIPEIEIITHNGIYWDCVVLGSKIIYWEIGDKHIATVAEFPIVTDATQVTPKEYLDALCTVYKAEFAIPAFLQTLALAGMNTWENNIIYPALLITWKSGCGKSSIKEMMKIAVWYTEKARHYALPSVTAQPLKVYAMDNSILFLDELTQYVYEKVEESLRNVINKDSWWRGLGMDNAAYHFRSPLFITGERTFKDESLNNRLMVLVMSEDYWIENTKEMSIRLKSFSCFKKVYERYTSLDMDINDMHRQYTYKLVRAGIDSRNADVWAYMFVINEIFEFWFTRDYLMKLMQLHLKSMWFDGKDEWMSDEGEFQMFLSKNIFNKKMHCIVEDYSDHEIMRCIFIDDTIYQKARWQFTMLVNKINSRCTDWTQRITLTNNGISIHIKTLNADTIDFVTTKIKEYILLTNPYNVARIDMSAGSAFKERTTQQSSDF